MRDILKRAIYGVVLLASIFISANIFAGIGDGSPNPTGGFGSGDNSAFEDPNASGTTDLGTEDLILQAPPPPNPIPLDGGSLILILSGIGAGATAIFRKVSR